MGQICDCLFRTHQHNRLNEIEEKILKYEQFMEQWLVNKSCCDRLYIKEKVIVLLKIMYLEFKNNKVYI